MEKTKIGRRVLVGGLAGSVLLPYAPQKAATQWVDRARLSDADSFAADIQQLNSLSISVKSEIHLAAAYRGPGLNTPVNVKSVSKTLLATLVLIAIDRGIIASVSEPILPLLGDFAPKSGLKPWVENITVDHLLSMRSGLARTSGPEYGAWVNSPNWVEYVLTGPATAAPGTEMNYSTGDYHLLSAILTNVTGRSTHELAQSWLGDPLEAEMPPWTRDPQGIYMGGNNMAISPNGMRRFGEMALAGGVHNGTRIISEDMLRAAWTPRARSPYSGHQYGYGWFQTLMSGVRVFYARGYGGQMIYVIPQRDTVVVMTSDANLPARSNGHGGVLNRLLSEKILPAISRA
ncbi:serine hydrolase domain-containing protein [Algicella marina]|uniref:serine hydrolase domain-containing protein n=1 Tax=Algicella marina TaxID=2683284 RepID=UPI00137A5791|nr:serine hydrolase [Algicella marina]